MENKQNDSKAIASLVLGILALVWTVVGWSALVGIVLAVVGLYLGINSKKESGPSGMATAGQVTSIIALVLYALSVVACIACAGAAGLLGIAGFLL